MPTVYSGDGQYRRPSGTVAPVKHPKPTRNPRFDSERWLTRSHRRSFTFEPRDDHVGQLLVCSGIVETARLVAGLSPVAPELRVIQRELYRRRVPGKILPVCVGGVAIEDRICTARHAQNVEVGLRNVPVAVRCEEYDAVDASRIGLCVPTAHRTTQRVTADVPGIDRRVGNVRRGSILIEEGEVQRHLWDDDGHTGVAGERGKRREVGVRVDAPTRVKDEAGSRIARRRFESVGFILLGDRHARGFLYALDAGCRPVKRCPEIHHKPRKQQDTESD